MNRIVTTMLLAIPASALLALSAAHAAGFDCGKASTAMEKAICADQALSQADEDMNDTYAFLGLRCRKIAARADLRATQRRWLADARKDFGADGPDAIDRLRTAYRTRNAVLAKLLAECTPHHGPTRAKVTVVQDFSNGYMVPFVRTEPPLPGWRINKALFGGYYGGYPPLEISGLKAFFARHKPDDPDNPENPDNDLPTFDILLNKGNLLVVHISGTDCPPDAVKCYPWERQSIFDLRTGSLVQLGNLYSKAGDSALWRKVNRKRIGLARAILAKLAKNDSDRDQYRRCIDDWKSDPGGLGEQTPTADGRMTFAFGNCSESSSYGTVGGTALDDLSVTMPLTELRPYLSAYGRSLLLSEGDVRAP